MTVATRFPVRSMYNAVPDMPKSIQNAEVSDTCLTVGRQPQLTSEPTAGKQQHT